MPSSYPPQINSPKAGQLPVPYPAPTAGGGAPPSRPPLPPAALAAIRAQQAQQAQQEQRQQEHQRQGQHHQQQPQYTLARTSSYASSEGSEGDHAANLLFTLDSSTTSFSRPANAVSLLPLWACGGRLEYRGYVVTLEGAHIVHLPHPHPPHRPQIIDPRPNPPPHPTPHTPAQIMDSLMSASYHAPLTLMQPAPQPQPVGRAAASPFQRSSLVPLPPSSLPQTQPAVADSLPAVGLHAIQVVAVPAELPSISTSAASSAVTGAPASAAVAGGSIPASLRAVGPIASTAQVRYTNVVTVAATGAPAVSRKQTPGPRPCRRCTLLTGTPDSPASTQGVAPESLAKPRPGRTHHMYMSSLSPTPYLLPSPCSHVCSTAASAPMTRMHCSAAWWR